VRGALVCAKRRAIERDALGNAFPPPVCVC
jgi:hypothetical protein